MRARGVAALVTAFLLVTAPAAFGCAALIGPRGTVRIDRTTTLSAYHAGVEHYITAFTFEGGGGGKFGSIVPLPGIPTKIEKGGEWTLQRLIRETRPQPVFAAGQSASLAATGGVKVIEKKRIDALDVTVVKGGGAAVADWAKKQGFVLTPDAPAVLTKYAVRSPIFMTAVFDAKAAQERQQQNGDGTPVHLTIPTSNPWVPLRILGVGSAPSDKIRADVYLLTDNFPALLPVREKGWELERRVHASDQLLADLRSDKGMEWLPAHNMWLTHLQMDAPAGTVKYDLAVDQSGRGSPSWLAAGFDPPPPTPKPTPAPTPEPTRAPIAAPVIPAEPAAHRGPWDAVAFSVFGAALIAAVTTLVRKRRSA